MSNGLKGCLSALRGSQLRLTLNGSNIQVVVVVEDFYRVFPHCFQTHLKS